MIKEWADRLFRWYCHPDYYPDIKGDLEELYNEHLQGNARIAQYRYAGDVLLLFRPTLIRPITKNSIIKDTGMFRNYFKISVRNLVKHRVFTGINVIGLAFGLASFLLINEYIRFERSYDRFFTDSDQLYRLTTDQVVDSVLGTRDAMSFHPSGRALVEEIPSILNYTTTYKFDEVIVRKGDQLMTEKKIVAADSNYFKLFDYEIISGDPETMLNDPNSLVLTESKAKAYFGDQNPIGETIELLGRFQRQFQVTGLIRDTPENTHYKFDILMSLKSIQDRLDNDGWNGFNYYTYLLIDRKADMEKVREQMPELSRKYIGEDSKLVFNLQPVEDIHLYSDFTFEPEIHGSAKSVNFLVIISVFILMIAWVNYVNLSTARAVDRAKEVGLRKVIGAHKGQLMFQFLFESLLVNLVGALLAIGVAELLLPYFNQLIGKDITEHVWNQPEFLKSLLVFFLIGTAVSGFYPAIVLSEFKPVTVLKGKFRNSKSGVLLRKGLVVVQFAASLILIAGTFVVFKQVNFMQQKDLGMDIDYVIGFSNPGYSRDQREEMTDRFKMFKEDLKNHHAIINAGMVTNLPGGGSSDISSTSGGVRIVGMTDRLEATTYMMWSDEGYYETIGMELIGGRYLDEDLQIDSSSCIVNEAFVRRFGIYNLDSVLNEKIMFGRDPDNDKYPIVGIVKDFNRTSLKKEVEPTVMFLWERPSYTLVKLNPQNYQEGLAHVETTWSKFFSNAPYDYTFIDQRFERLYQEDKRFGKVFGSFSVFAIIVAILGLFGLSAFMAIQRTKEVGVRKVMGASVFNIIAIFYKDFLSLVGIAAIIGIPIVYYAMDSWLDNYAYRINFPWVLIGLAILMIVLFALLTVGYQTYKVAIINPSKTLRYE